MPILFADKSKRFIAAVHCGRKGLEKGIIKNQIKIFDKIGSYRNDLLVAIGPSISKENYLVDKNTLKNFYKNINNKELISDKRKTKIKLYLNELNILKKKELIQLDLRKNARMQLLNEDIADTNIEISHLCTYNSKNEFNSWRRDKSGSRQWSFISP